MEWNHMRNTGGEGHDPLPFPEGGVEAARGRPEEEQQASDQLGEHILSMLDSIQESLDEVGALIEEDEEEVRYRFPASQEDSGELPPAA